MATGPETTGTDATAPAQTSPAHDAPPAEAPKSTEERLADLEARVKALEKHHERRPAS